MRVNPVLRPLSRRVGSRRCAWLIGAAVAIAFCPPVNAQEPILLDRAELVLDGSPTPPRADRPGEWVDLPDDWRLRRPDRGGIAWYRMQLDAPSGRGADPWAVYLPSVNMNAQVWVNGVSVGGCGRFEEPVAHCFNRPLFLRVPGPLILDGSNRVEVKIFVYPHQYGRLGALWLGPEHRLASEYEWRYTLQITLSQIATAVVASVAAFLCALWIASGFEGVYGYFVLSTAAWTIASCNYWLRDLPVSHWVWERIIHLGLDVCLVALVPWVHRILGERWPRVESAAAATATLGLAITAPSSAEAFYPLVNWVHAATLLWAIYACVVVIRRHGCRPFLAWDGVVYALVGPGAVLLGSHDLAVQFGWVGTPVYLAPLTVPLILPSFGATLTRRFLEAGRRRASDARELNVRVQEREEVLARSYHERRALERNEARCQERQRLTREIHDGLGGHLVATLSLVEGGKLGDSGVAEALRMAVEDMRLVLDSADLGAACLGEVLGLGRERLEPVVVRHQIRFVWQVPLHAYLDVPLGSERGMHVLRVLQEAVTNGVRHAGPKQISIAAIAELGTVRIEVRDDGSGIQPGAGRGRGIRNMQERALHAGACLRILSGSTGTCVALELDMDAAGSTPRPESILGRGPRRLPLPENELRACDRSGGRGS